MSIAKPPILRFSRASELGQYPADSLTRALGLADSSEDFFYASNNVRNFCFLFKEEPPVIGPQRLGDPLGENGVLRMEGLKLGAFLGANDGVRLGHESILLPSGAIRLGSENSN
jgi:hypothetical protein